MREIDAMEDTTHIADPIFNVSEEHSNDYLRDFSVSFQRGGNTKYSPVYLQASTWEEDDDRSVGEITLRMKWTGTQIPHSVYRIEEGEERPYTMPLWNKCEME